MVPYLFFSLLKSKISSLKSLSKITVISSIQEWHLVSTGMKMFAHRKYQKVLHSPWQRYLPAGFGNKIRWWDKASWRMETWCDDDSRHWQGINFDNVFELTKDHFIFRKTSASCCVGIQVLVKLPGKWCKYYSGIPLLSQQVVLLALPLTLSSCKFTLCFNWYEQNSSMVKNYQKTINVIYISKDLAIPQILSIKNRNLK